MNRITSIEQQKNADDRYSVFIDGEFAFGICDFDLYTLKLRVGDEITDEKRNEIEEVIDTEKCKSYAVNLVARKMYSKKEIKDKLLKKGFTLTAISGVISILEEYGYINDDYFAKLFIETYMKRYGVNKIKYELKLKGIQEDNIAENLENFNNDDDLLELIKTKTRGKVIDRELCSKIIRSFAAKGFEIDKIKSCLSKITDDVDDFE